MRLQLLNIGLVLLIFLSCKGDFDVFIPNEEEPSLEAGDINGLFAIVAPPEEKVSWDASQTLEIKTQNQLSINLPANALVDQDGKTVEGQVEVIIREVYSKENLLLNKLHTTTDDQILELEGGLFLSLSQGQQNLQLMPQASITVEFPTSNHNEAIQLFYGDKAAGKFNWVKASSSPDQLTPILFKEVVDPISNAPTSVYQVNANQLGWIGLGTVSVQELSGQALCLNLSEDYQPTNTAVYAVFQGINTLVRLKWSDIPEAGQFCWENVPNIGKVTIVAISEWRKGVYHIGTTKHIIDQTTRVIELEMKETTIGNMLELISGL